MIPEDVARRYLAEGAWGEETLPQRLQQICARDGDRIAIIDGATRLTFAETAAMIGAAAGAFAAAGVGPGDVVSWQLPAWWEAVIVHHAALRLGAIPGPVHPGFRDHELDVILDQSRPALLVTPGTWRGFDHGALAARMAARHGITQTMQVRAGDAFAEALAHPPAPAHDGSPGDLALLLYTSGTSGVPKGVQHSHRGLLCEIDSFPVIHDLTPEDRYLCGSPITHIAGLAYGVLAPFALGTSSVLLERWDPALALRAIAEERATYQTAPPTFLQTLAAHPDAARVDLSSFRLFSTGGAAIQVAPIRAAAATLGCVVKRAYGSTEVPTLTAGRMDDDDRARFETDGRVIGTGELRIVDPDGTDVAPGAEGEIWARAPEMLVGYRDPALDATAFAPDGWYRTGDLGRIDTDGALHVTGRIADIIIRGGENISAPEVEDAIAGHPDVIDVAVVGYPDPMLGERACAFIVARDGTTIDLASLRAHLTATGLATMKWPERIELRADLPRTASGKVIKEQLRTALAD